jgi:hypothetical protein
VLNNPVVATSTGAPGLVGAGVGSAAPAGTVASLGVAPDGVSTGDVSTGAGQLASASAAGNQVVGQPGSALVSANVLPNASTGGAANNLGGLLGSTGGTSASGGAGAGASAAKTTGTGGVHVGLTH